MKFNYFKESNTRFGLASIGRSVTSKLSTFFPNISTFLGKKILLKPNGKRHYPIDLIQPEKELSLATSIGAAHVNLFGTGDKVIIVSHGWADTSDCFQHLVLDLTKQGYMVAAIDHIGHGKSSGNKSHLPSFIETLELLVELFNEENVNVHAIIGHSMGALATLNLPQYLLENKKIILISSPIKFFELMFDKVEQFGISRKLLYRVLESITYSYGSTWQQLAMESHRSKLTSDITFIHDRFDRLAPFEDLSCFLTQEKNTLIITEGLGHRKILGDTTVIKHITQVLSSG
jgi:pimeloyl-ACP methyl ester carboxylesterase